MPTETEIKYLDVDHAALRRKLAELGAQHLNRGFECNVVYDDADRSLKAKGILLRLREKNSRFVLTLKQASEQVSSTVKVCEESETEVTNARALREILTGLGYRPALCYEKMREKWLFLGCEVCLDTLPFGFFAEIEGCEEDIAACAKALELPQKKASTATYHDLNHQYRAAHNQPPDESFVFDNEAKAKVLARRATD